MSGVIFKDNSALALDTLRAAKEAALEEIGLAAEGFAKKLCPVDTGRLRNSISHATSGDDEYIGTNVEYAPYVELGTHRTPAQPYLKPAVAEHRDTYVAIIKRHMRGE